MREITTTCHRHGLQPVTVLTGGPSHHSAVWWPKPSQCWQVTQAVTVLTGDPSRHSADRWPKPSQCWQVTQAVTVLTGDPSHHSADWWPKPSQCWLVTQVVTVLTGDPSHYSAGWWPKPSQCWQVTQAITVLTGDPSHHSADWWPKPSQCWQMASTRRMLNALNVKKTIPLITVLTSTDMAVMLCDKLCSVSSNWKLIQRYWMCSLMNEAFLSQPEVGKFHGHMQGFNTDDVICKGMFVT